MFLQGHIGVHTNYENHGGLVMLIHVKQLDNSQIINQTERKVYHINATLY